RVGERPDLLLSEAELRMRFKDAATAESLLHRALDQAPERADIANALGRSLVLQDRFEESLAFYRRAIEAEPGAVRHRQELGVALLKSSQPHDAAQILEQALKVAPHEQITLGYLALALREMGDSRYGELVPIERFVRSMEIAPPAGFADVASFNRALSEELEALHTRRAAPLNQTLLNGTQTPGSLFANHAKALDLIRRQIDDAIGAYISDLPDDPSHPFLSRKNREFSLSGSWSCRLRSSGYHSNHLHNEGWISSAYYVALPDEVADAAGGQGALKFGESKFALGESDRPEQVVRPQVGKLVLFPSYFWHGTVPFVSQAARLTIAFDVVPGKAGVAPGAKRL
ncbi:MAG TPA: putative 2OG-Fe(II) oxygenase, partial [Rhizomicrobium sp.]|nr:putative 2OG-Fe(II) oxygenase [Rhizomicrobium sp.]